MKRVSGKKSNAEIKKAKRNMRIIILALIITIIVVVCSIKVLPTIRTIDVEIISDNSKEVKITKNQVLELSNLKKGDKLYKELRSQIENRIEENPYIKSAKIERNLSGKVKIIVTQREATYIVNYAGEYIYIDREGFILEVSNQKIEGPILIGLVTEFSELSIGSSPIRLKQEDLEKLEVLNNILSTLKNNGVENIITSIDITNKKDFILKLENEGKEIHIGDGTDFNTKALYIKKILEFEEEHNGIIYINKDLDDGYVYFKEQ